MTPAEKYAAAFATWRARMPRPMRDPETSTCYWLDTLHPRREKFYATGGGEGRTMDRMFDLTYFEKRSMAAHRRLGRWR